MAAFAASLIKFVVNETGEPGPYIWLVPSQNINGTLLTLTDYSNYDINDEGFTQDDFKSRVFKGKDADNNILFNVDAPYLISDQNSIAVEIPKDMWLQVELILTMTDDTVYSTVLKLPMVRQAEYKLNQTIELYPKNKRKTVQDTINQVRNLIENARFVGKEGDGDPFNDQITAANKLIDTVCPNK